MPSMVAVVNQSIPYRPHKTRPEPLPTARPILHTTAAPAVQPPSPRVHFATTASISRPLTNQESWTLYNFETHSRACNNCRFPYKRFRSGASLCPQGQSFASAVANTCYLHAGEIYERHQRKPMRLEVPHTYTFLREQLRVMEEIAFSRASAKPKVRIHVDERRKEAPRRSESTEVVIEAGRSDRRGKEKYRHEERSRDKEYRREDRTKEYRREERGRDKENRPKEYRHEEKRERRREDMEVVAGQKKYHTQERRPTWVEEGGYR